MSLVHTTLIVILFCIAIPALAQDTGLDRGMSVSRDYLDKYGNRDAIDQLIINPMMGEGSLETLDGETQFQAPMVCGADQPFVNLQLFISSSGDLGIADLSVDRDHDGIYDYNVSNAPHISGVCSNGYISCVPGTWDGCLFYRWNIDDNQTLYPESVSLTELGSCRCINNSCSPSYSTLYFPTLQSQIGSGIVTALSQSDYSLAISNVETNNSIITYYGQTISGCTGVNVTAQNYFANPSMLETAPSALINSTTPESSIYNTVLNSESASDIINNVDINNCTVTRQVSIDEVGVEDIVQVASGYASTQQIDNHTIDIVIGRQGDNYYWSPGRCTVFEEEISIYVVDNTRILDAEIIDLNYDDYIQIIINDALVYNGPRGDWTNINGMPTPPIYEYDDAGQIISTRYYCELGTSRVVGNPINIADYFNHNGEITIRMRTGVYRGGEAHARIRLLVDTECRENPDTFNDTCAPYQESETCRLRDESMDGVTTFTNFVQTGLPTLPQTAVLSTPTCSLNFVRDWFEISRTYECEGDSPYDFTSAAERVHTIETTATETSYTDIRTSLDGQTSPQLIEGDLSVYNEISVESCTQQCQVLIPSDSNSATLFGLTSDQINHNNRDQTEFRQCSNNTCPLNEGETLLQDCGCINGFSNVAIMLQLIRLAGSDMLCSSLD